jgi:hypothetical protein
MKLAAVYNVFDCEEMLEKSINSIRSEVDLVIVLYQEVSNFGFNHKIDILSFLKTIKGIDVVVKYDTNLFHQPHQNELSKRVAGVKIALEKGCTHFLHVDCDEIYDTKQFTAAKSKILENDYDSTCCGIIDYYKFENLQIEPDGHLYVPFIHKLIKGTTTFGHSLQYPVLVDKTRKSGPTNNFKIFSNEELMMHHYTWIREDPRSKLLNSTARHSYEWFLDEIIKEFDNFSKEDELVRLHTGLLVPLRLIDKIQIPYAFNKVKTIIKQIGD